MGVFGKVLASFFPEKLCEVGIFCSRAWVCDREECVREGTGSEPAFKQSHDFTQSADMKPNQTAQQTTTALPKESFIDLLDKYLLVPSQTLKWSQILEAQR